MRRIEEFRALMQAFVDAPADTAEMHRRLDKIEAFVAAGLAAEAERDAWREECAASEDWLVEKLSTVTTPREAIAELARRVAARTGGTTCPTKTS